MNSIIDPYGTQVSELMNLCLLKSLAHLRRFEMILVVLMIKDIIEVR